MKAFKRAAMTTFAAALSGIIAGPAAIACGPGQPVELSTMLQFRVNAQNPLESATPGSLADDLNKASSGKRASIVGMWSFQFVSQGL